MLWSRMTAPPYYILHFRRVIEAVKHHYGAILSEAERAHVACLEKLPLPALCLYVRLANRKGPYFRLDKLVYAECAPLHDTISLLAERKLLVSCTSLDLPHGTQALWSCFTHPELCAFLGMRRKKPELCERLDQAPDKLSALLECHPVLSLHPSDCWPFLKFLFFGELTENLSGFVVQELGHIVTEALPDVTLSPKFSTRAEALGCWRMENLYAEFRRLREEQDSQSLLNWWRAQQLDRTVLPALAHARHDRLIERLCQRLEREEAYAEALMLYASVPAAPCRERRAKLLKKLGREEEALALCEEMLESPAHAEEDYAARQLLNRLQKKTRRSDARTLLHASAELWLKNNAHSIEAAVLQHYQAEGWSGVHAENWLWNALFGLLFWDIVYDGGFGGFHQPLQMYPSDLYGPEFYSRRKDAIEARLRLLSDHDACLRHVTRIHRAKQGTANPFLGWHEATLTFMEALLDHVPASALIAVLRHMAEDFRHNSRGFPDLFLWREAEYRFVEVKSLNDQLSARQYHWLQFLAESGVQVQVVRALIAVPEQA